MSACTSPRVSCELDVVELLLRIGEAVRAVLIDSPVLDAPWPLVTRCSSLLLSGITSGMTTEVAVYGASAARFFYARCILFSRIIGSAPPLMSVLRRRSRGARRRRRRQPLTPMRLQRHPPQLYAGCICRWLVCTDTPGFSLALLAPTVAPRRCSATAEPSSRAHRVALTPRLI